MELIQVMVLILIKDRNIGSICVPIYKIKKGSTLPVYNAKYKISSIFSTIVNSIVFLEDTSISA